MESAERGYFTSMTDRLAALEEKANGAEKRAEDAARDLHLMSGRRPGGTGRGVRAACPLGASWQRRISARGKPTRWFIGEAVYSAGAAARDSSSLMPRGREHIKDIFVYIYIYIYAHIWEPVPLTVEFLTLWLLSETLFRQQGL